MLTLPVMIIETADTPWEHRLVHRLYGKSWTLQILHKTPESHLWLNCWGWRLAEHCSRVDVRLDLSLGCLPHGVRAVNILKYGNRGSGSYCSLCVPSLRATTKTGPGGIMKPVDSIRSRLRLDPDRTRQRISRCGDCGDCGGVPKRIGRYGSIHCRRLMPGLRVWRRRGSSSRRSRNRNLRLCLRMRRWLSLSEEMVASPLKYVANVEAYQSSQATACSVVVMVVTMMYV